jgi:hypothetical protein
LLSCSFNVKYNYVFFIGVHDRVKIKNVIFKKTIFSRRIFVPVLCSCITLFIFEELTTLDLENASRAGQGALGYTRDGLLLLKFETEANGDARSIQYI